MVLSCPLRPERGAVTMCDMKVSLLRCVCWALLGTQLAGCGGAGESLEIEPTVAVDDGTSQPTPKDAGGAAAAGDEPGDESEESAEPECAELEQQPAGCGQLSFRPGSSCQLVPTANDLTRSPRGVRFDCTRLVRGPNGYDFDASGHLALTGDTCAALQTGGSHRVTLLLACGFE